MFAYDYKNKFTLRVWGSTFKPALFKELLRLGVKVLDRTEATALLTTARNGKKHGAGACAMDVRTGKFYILRAKETVLTMSRPARVWLFNPDMTGLCEFRPMQSIGSGHAMGYKAGIEFTMMEKSVKGEFSAAGPSCCRTPLRAPQAPSSRPCSLYTRRSRGARSSAYPACHTSGT